MQDSLPRIFISPGILIAAVVFWLFLAWGIFLAADIWGIISLNLGQPAWQVIFNRYPVEWATWTVLAVGIVAAGYLSGRLDGESQKGASRFFLFFALGLAFMLIEQAGSIRHQISDMVGRITGPEIFSVSYIVISDVPYFALLSVLPLYALGRYGRYIWHCASARGYLAAGVILFAMAAIGNGLRFFNDFYFHFGAWVDGNLFGGRFPVPEEMTQEWAHFFLVDSPIKESLELLAATMLLAAVFAFVESDSTFARAGRA